MNRHLKNASLKLMVFLMLLMVSCSNTGNNDNGPDGNSSGVNQPENLEHGELSPKNINAFEQRALQKLQDLKDYIEILSDSRINKTFRKQAMKMAFDLFNSADNSVSLALNGNDSLNIQKVDSFFLSLKNEDLAFPVFEIHQVSVINNIQPQNDNEYRGTVKCALLFRARKAGIVGNKKKVDVNCEIIVKKVQKKFGKETKQVWEVFLGDIIQIQ